MSATFPPSANWRKAPDQALLVGHALAGILAPAGEEWGDVAIVEYPSFEAFRTLVESDAYKADADPHRRAALANWRLIATAKMDMPG